MFHQALLALIAIGITAPIHNKLYVVSAFTFTHSLSTPMNLNAPISSYYSLQDNELNLTNERRNILRRSDVTPTRRRQRRRYLSPRLSNSNSNKEETHKNDGDDDSTPKRIYILGGGFGGLNTALTLASLPWPTTMTTIEEEGVHQQQKQQQRPIITLVDRKERFVFLPLLYELCVGDAELEEVAPTFQTLLKDSNVEFLQREIEGVDVKNSMVYLSQPPSFSTTTTTDQSRRQEGASYDALVIATGADVNLSAIPGAQSYAIPFYTVEDCFELRRTLALFKSVATTTGGSDDADADTGVDIDRVVNVVVVGGGYSGVELALNVSERLKRSYSKVEITLVHRGDEILQYATEYNRKTGVDRLKKAGVTLKTGSSVVDVKSLHDAAEEDEMEDKFSSDYLNQRRCRVTLEPKSGSSASTTAGATDVVDADLLLWTAGASSTNIANGVLNSILPRDSSGRVVTDSLLCTRAKGCESDSNVFALGDRARVARRKPYGATAQVAIQQASVVSWNVYASLLNGDESVTKSTANEQQPLDLLPFNYLDLGEMLTLGEEDASITSLDGLVRLDGAGASILRRLIYAVRMPTARQALSAALLGAEKRVESLVAKQRQKQNNVSMKKKKMSWK